MEARDGGLLMDPVSRRRFLQRSGAALAGAFLAACGVRQSSGTSVGTSPGSSTTAGGGGIPAEIRIGVYAGDQAMVQRNIWVPAIEEQFGTTVLFDDSTTTAKSLATLEAEADDPQHTILMLENPGARRAALDGYLQPFDLSQMPNLSSSAPPWALYEDDHALAFALNYMGPLTNAELGLPEISSYQDLLHPEFEGKVVIPSMSLIAGVYLLILGGLSEMGEAIPAGAESFDAEGAVEAGWGYLEKLKPQLHSIDTQVLPAFQLLGAGEIGVYAPSYSRYIAPYRSEGTDMRVAFPSEGTFLAYNTLTIVKGGPAMDQASAMADLILGEDFQVGNAEAAAVGPVNTDVTLSEELQENYVPAAGDLPENAFPQGILNWEFIAENHADWIDRFDAEIAL
ncbi:MAG: extracellular solute-binding protein [Acidimicrobiia bacterium]|nr:extracellular solute-binding protein [Acidimicrobiia bacterium]